VLEPDVIDADASTWRRLGWRWRAHKGMQSRPRGDEPRMRAAARIDLHRFARYVVSGLLGGLIRSCRKVLAVYRPERLGLLELMQSV
jgi:hypothetical protein